MDEQENSAPVEDTDAGTPAPEPEANTEAPAQVVLGTSSEGGVVVEPIPVNQ